MTIEQQGELLLAIAQVLVEVIYRDERLPAVDRRRFANFLAAAITATSEKAYPFE